MKETASPELRRLTHHAQGLKGLASGVPVATEDSTRVIVTALALGMISNVFDNIPEVGGYLTKIFSAGGTFVAGAAMMIISRNVWNRFKP